MFAHPYSGRDQQRTKVNQLSDADPSASRDPGDNLANADAHAAFASSAAITSDMNRRMLNTANAHAMLEAVLLKQASKQGWPHIFASQSSHADLMRPCPFAGKPPTLG